MKPPSERTIDPYSETTRVDAAREILKLGGDKDTLEYAYALDPFNPLVHLALAAFEKDENAAEFLRHYTLGRLPEDVGIRVRAAELLEEQKLPKRALKELNWVLQKDPENVKAKAMLNRLNKGAP